LTRGWASGGATEQPRSFVVVAKTADNVGRLAQLALVIEKLLSTTP
jgi:hypothetical protein